MNLSSTFVAISVVALLAGGALLLTREQPVQSVKSTPPAPAAAGQTEPAAPVEPAPAVTVVAPQPSAAAAASVASPAEASLMVELRDLWKASPARALELARSGEARFGDSKEAAERSWVIVRALTELGRHEEARDEGRKLLERYRDTRWGQDVYRHLFVNPPTHPSERGYGRELEAE